MPWLFDETTQAKVWQDPSTGKVRLRSSDGAVVNVDPGGVANALSVGGYESVNPEQAQDYDAKVAQTTGSAVVAGAEAAAAGAFDAGTALVTAPLKVVAPGNEVVQQLSGRKVLENVAAVAGELFGGDETGESVARRYAEGARERAQHNPDAAMAGRVVGEVAGAVASGGASALKGVAGAALEGAAMGAQQSAEDAYIHDTELTRDKVIAGAGLGALFGGGVALGVKGASRLWSRRGSRGATPFDSPRSRQLPGKGAYREAAPEYDALAQRALGDVPQAPGVGAAIRDIAEQGQSAVAGVERQTLRESGALRWDKRAKRKRDLWYRRDEIMEGATADLTADLERLNKASRSVSDEVVDVRLKRSHVAKRIQGDSAQQVSATRGQLDRVRAALDEIADDADEIYGNKKLAKHAKKAFAQIEAPAHVSANPAESFIALDRAKRLLQKNVVRLRKAAARQQGTGDVWASMESRAMADRLDGVQESTRQLLMDGQVWGKAADDQRAINAAWENFFDEDRHATFSKNIMQRLGVDYESGFANYRADPAKVSAWVKKLGRQEGAFVDDAIRQHVDDVQRLSDVIESSFDINNKAAAAEVREAVANIKRTLASADETVRVANQIDAVISKEGGGLNTLLGGAVGGGLVGGPIGALAGAAASFVTQPGRLIKSLAAIEALSQNVDTRIGKSIRGYLSKPARNSAKITKASSTTRGRRGKARTAVNAAGTAFMGDYKDQREAYRRRATDIAKMATDPMYASGQMATATEGLAQEAPKLASAISAQAVAGAQYLKGKLPGPAAGSNPLQPNIDTLGVSDADIAKFARIWETVNNPLSILDDLERGDISREQVEALESVYPRLFAEMRSSILEELGKRKEPLPYESRKTLDLLLGLNGAGEPSMAPSFLRIMHSMGEQAEQPEQMQPRAPVNQVDVAGQFGSLSSQLETRF